MVGPRGHVILERGLRITQAVLIAGIAVVIWNAVVQHDKNAGQERATATSVDAEEFTGDAADQLAPLDWYAPIWERDLRQPPIPPVEKAKPIATPKPAPPPTLPKLMGTFVEGETAWAHVISPQVGVRVLHLGGVIDGFAITTIEPGRVELTIDDRSYWIEIKRPRNQIAQRP